MAQREELERKCLDYRKEQADILPRLEETKWEVRYEYMLVLRLASSVKCYIRVTTGWTEKVSTFVCVCTDLKKQVVPPEGSVDSKGFIFQSGQEVVMNIKKDDRSCFSKSWMLDCLFKGQWRLVHYL